MIVVNFSCECDSVTPELVSASVVPVGGHEYVFRCAGCGKTFTSRREPMRFPIFPDYTDDEREAEPS